MKPPKPDLREPPVYVVLIDSRGIISDINTQGRPSARTDNAVLSQYKIGKSYLDHCRDDDHRAEVQALLKRKRTLVSFVFSSRCNGSNVGSLRLAFRSAKSAAARY